MQTQHRKGLTCGMQQSNLNVEVFHLKVFLYGKISLVMIFFFFQAILGLQGKRNCLMYSLLTLCHEMISVLCNTWETLPEAGLPFMSLVFGLRLCMWTQEKTEFSERVSLGSLPLTRGCQQILLLGKRRHRDGKLLLILGCRVCLCLRGRKSFGQMGLLLTTLAG